MPQDRAGLCEYVRARAGTALSPAYTLRLEGDTTRRNRIYFDYAPCAPVAMGEVLLSHRGVPQFLQLAGLFLMTSHRTCFPSSSNLKPFCCAWRLGLLRSRRSLLLSAWSRGILCLQETGQRQIENRESHSNARPSSRRQVAVSPGTRVTTV
jgi:hypothetical protein